MASDTPVAEESQSNIVIPLARQPREGWRDASRLIAESSDDALAWPEFGNIDDELLVW